MTQAYLEAVWFSIFTQLLDDDLLPVRAAILYSSWGNGLSAYHGGKHMLCHLLLEKTEGCLEHVRGKGLVDWKCVRRLRAYNETAVNAIFSLQALLMSF